MLNESVLWRAFIIALPPTISEESIALLLASNTTLTEDCLFTQFWEMAKKISTGSFSAVYLTGVSTDAKSIISIESSLT